MTIKSESIRHTLPHMIRWMILAFLVLILPVNYVLQIYDYHSYLKRNSDAIFAQLNQLIDNNARDLEISKQEFTERAIRAAEFVAYFTKHYPAKIPSAKHTRELAEKLNIDEIHYFTPKGKIFAGTHPQYYGLSFNSGKQMQFFLPMLKDHSLQLCQDIVPNTAESKPMQYAATWLADGSGIVQIGLQPRLLLEVVDSKSLENAVKHLPTGQSGHLIIVDKQTHEIQASTNKNLNGIIPALARTESRSKGQAYYHQNYFDKKFCVFSHEYGNYKIYRFHDHDFAVSSAISSSLLVLFYVGLVATLVLGFISWYINRKVTTNLTKIAHDLTRLEVGHLERITLMTGIKEFDEVTFYVNQLLLSVRSSWDKISFILKKGKMPTGIFAYNRFYKQSFYNERLLDLLGIDENLSKERVLEIIQERIKLSNFTLLDPKDKIYAYSNEGKTLYLRIEKEVDEQGETYYVTDVSAWWSEIYQLRGRSNLDELTQLYNRRGFTQKMDELFAKPGALGSASALIMIDADQLKKINDVYGHYSGDVYLFEIAKTIRKSVKSKSICARLGGDEFAVFVYGYDSKEELDEVISSLKLARKQPFILEKEDTGETIEFSLGYAYYPGDATDYHQLMRLADTEMYQEKRQRKLAGI